VRASEILPQALRRAAMGLKSEIILAMPGQALPDKERQKEDEEQH
jgi:ABC-type arginine/histidine transport system permease subunit